MKGSLSEPFLLFNKISAWKCCNRKEENEVEFYVNFFENFCRQNSEFFANIIPFSLKRNHGS